MTSRAAPSAMVDGNGAQSEQTALRFWSTAACLAILIFILGLATSPVPGVNESHWLCKARAFWDPTYCPDDFFLKSGNAHYLFLAGIGLVTQVCSLTVTAWLGRALAAVAMGMGLAWLLKSLSPARAFVAVTFFALIQSHGNLSGEWLFGGVEAKQFSYALLFAALGAFRDGRFRLSSGLVGLSVAVHPVVGAWGLIAFTVVAATCPSNSNVRPSRREMAIMAAIAFGLALPGLIPALGVLRSAPPDVANAATVEQVYGRLRHHLDPTDFAWSGYLLYGLLLLHWMMVRLFPQKLQVASKPFARFIEAAVIFAAVGLLIGWGAVALDGRLLAAAPQPLGPWCQRAAALLKFYPFRLVDLVLPLGVASAAASIYLKKDKWHNSVESSWLAMALFLMVVPGLLAPQRDKDDRLTPELWADWRQSCSCIETSTPPTAMFVTPTFSRHFKWYAHRAEFVCHKDCPQDAPGILEWRRRMNLWRTWRPAAFVNGVTPEELRDLRHLTGATHLLIHAAVDIRAKPIHRNHTFAIYALPDD
jgi:hypothetical protein